MKWFALALALTFVGCAHPNTSQLDAQGLRNHRAAEAAKLVRDVTKAAITANTDKRLSNDATATVLAVNYKALGVIEKAAVGFEDAVFALVKATRDSLPAGLAAEVDKYLVMILAIIDKVRG